MLNSNELREIIKEIFKLDDEFVVPMDSGWYAPKYDEEKIESETYVGYRILERACRNELHKLRFRLSFIGHLAEELAVKTLSWKTDSFVQNLFNKNSARIDWIPFSEILSYPLKDADLVTWFTDIDVVENSDTANLSQDEQKILLYIEEYLDTFLENDGYMTVSEIRKWQKVEDLVECLMEIAAFKAKVHKTEIEPINTYPMICNAMKAVKNRMPVYTEQDDGTENFRVQYKSINKDKKMRWSD